LADQRKTDAANIQFKKAQRAEEGKKAMAEYEAEAVAVRAKTARLKALRLARDAAAGKVSDEAPAAVEKKSGKKGKAKSANLSDWLKDREGSGRRN
jgi:hypothetical protein